MIKGILNLPWFIWAALAFIIAVIYIFVWPHKAAIDSTGFRYFVLRWGHALVWVLLAINFVLRGIDTSFNRIANMIALTGGLIYLLFMVMTFVMK